MIYFLSTASTPSPQADKEKAESLLAFKGAWGTAGDTKPAHYPGFPPPMQYMGAMTHHLSPWQLAAH